MKAELSTPMDKVDHVSCERDALDGLLGSLSASVRCCTVCRIPKNAQACFAPANTVTILYVIAGSGFFGMGNKAAQMIGAQNVLIVPPQTRLLWIGDQHPSGDNTPYYAAVDDNLALLQKADQADESICVIRAEIEVSNGGVAGFFDWLLQFILEALVEDDAASRIFDLIITELAAPKRGTQTVVDGLMTAFLVLLLRQHLQRGHAPSSVFSMMTDPRLARAMAGVLERPDGQHSIESLAAVAGMSRSAFIETFRKVFAQSPNQFLQGFRLKFAAHLLTTTDLPIQSVAVSVGYSSRSYFSRTFRAAFALDPSAYRGRYRA